MRSDRNVRRDARPDDSRARHKHTRRDVHKEERNEFGDASLSDSDYDSMKQQKNGSETRNAEKSDQVLLSEGKESKSADVAKEK